MSWTIVRHPVQGWAPGLPVVTYTAIIAICHLHSNIHKIFHCYFFVGPATRRLKNGLDFDWLTPRLINWKLHKYSFSCTYRSSDFQTHISASSTFRNSDYLSWGCFPSNSTASKYEMSRVKMYYISFAEYQAKSKFIYKYNLVDIIPWVISTLIPFAFL